MPARPGLDLTLPNSSETPPCWTPESSLTFYESSHQRFWHKKPGSQNLLHRPEKKKREGRHSERVPVNADRASSPSPQGPSAPLAPSTAHCSLKVLEPPQPQ